VTQAEETSENPQQLINRELSWLEFNQRVLEEARDPSNPHPHGKVPALVDDGHVIFEGGAIAHGHPIGATGAVLTTRLLHAMQRDGISKGVITLCIGGGQGIALAIEAL